MIRGREREQQSLEALLKEEGPSAIFLWGVAGVGKSTLANAFLVSAHEAGASVLTLDCAAIEPTPRGFEAALAGSDAQLYFLENFEAFGLMDQWLLQNFRPRLGASCKLLICSRMPPSLGWQTNPPSHPFVEVHELQGLDYSDAIDWLVSSGLSRNEASRLAQLAVGHPLTLELALATSPELCEARMDWSNVLQTVSRLYLEDVSDADVRLAMEAASVTRRLTRGLLAYMLPEHDTHALFDSLCDLGFTQLTSEGLKINESIQQAIAATLKASDPETYRRLRRRSWRYIQHEMGQDNLWKYTADLIYLIEHPVVREAFFPSEHRDVQLRPARLADKTRVLEIAARHEPATVTAQVEKWFDLAPETFHVAQQGGAVVGYYQVLHSQSAAVQNSTHDRLIKDWQHHLASQEVAARAPALFIRRWLSEAHGERPGAIQAACWLDLKRSYMALRPDLRRVYLSLSDLQPYADVAIGLGFQILDDLYRDVDGQPCHTAMLDFGPASVDGWITRLVAAELGFLEGSLLDHSSRELRFEQHAAKLTPLEFGVLEVLLNRSGKTVTRDELLFRVWGEESVRSSNVVDVIIAALRRKLPTAAGKIETIRGLGYRFASAVS